MFQKIKLSSKSNNEKFIRARDDDESHASLWSHVLEFDSSASGRGHRYNIERYSNFRARDGRLLLFFMALLEI